MHCSVLLYLLLLLTVNPSSNQSYWSGLGGGGVGGSITGNKGDKTVGAEQNPWKKSTRDANSSHREQEGFKPYSSARTVLVRPYATHRTLTSYHFSVLLFLLHCIMHNAHSSWLILVWQGEGEDKMN